MQWLAYCRYPLMRCAHTQYCFINAHNCASKCTSQCINICMQTKSDEESLLPKQDAARRDAIKDLREGLYSVNGDVIDEVLTNA